MRQLAQAHRGSCRNKNTASPAVFAPVAVPINGRDTRLVRPAPKWGLDRRQGGLVPESSRLAARPGAPTWTPNASPPDEARKQEPIVRRRLLRKAGRRKRACRIAPRGLLPPVEDEPFIDGCRVGSREAAQCRRVSPTNSTSGCHNLGEEPRLGRPSRASAVRPARKATHADCRQHGLRCGYDVHAVHFLDGLPDDVKVALVAVGLIAFLAGVLYLERRFGDRRG